MIFFSASRCKHNEMMKDLCCSLSRLPLSSILVTARMRFPVTWCESLVIFFKIKLDTKTLRCLFTSIFWPFPQGCILFTFWRKEQKGLKISKLLMCVIVWGLSDVSIFDEQLSVSGLPFPGEIFYSFIYIFFETSNHDFWLMLIFSRIKLKSLVEK